MGFGFSFRKVVNLFKAMKRKLDVEDFYQGVAPGKQSTKLAAPLVSTAQTSSITKFFPVEKKENQQLVVFSPRKVQWTRIDYDSSTRQFQTSQNGSLFWGRFNGSSSWVQASLPPWTAIKAFDLDSTLIRSLPKKNRSRGAPDWAPWHQTKVAEKLRCEAAQNGSRVIIVSNQRGVTTCNVPAQEIQQRIEAAITMFLIPCDVFFAIEDDLFRKPRTGIWDFFIQKCNKGVIPNKLASFYVGDAAGRLPGTGGRKKKDFSDTDYKFALNVGIPFFTPEQYFLGRKELVPETFAFDPRVAFPPKLLGSVGDFCAPEQQHVLFLVGPPGSGKTHFCHHYVSNHIRIFKEGTETADMRHHQTRVALDEGRSVVIDLQNRDTLSRKPYISIIKAVERQKRRDISTIAVVFDYPKQFCLHLIKFGQLTTALHQVPAERVNTYYKLFEAPSKHEGFSSVICRTLDTFVPGPFKDSVTKRLFFSFLT